MSISFSDKWSSSFSAAQTSLGKAKTGISDFWNMMAAPDPPAAKSEELGIYYVTDRILGMGFPSENSPLSGSKLDDVLIRYEKLNKLVNENHINRVSQFFEKYHQDQYMIWNISEKKYDYEKFNNQVIEVNFPGYPAPPLEQMMQLCTSIHGWLNADPKNVAVVHCQTGKGRTVTTIAAYLAWSGAFPSPSDSLRATVEAMHGTVKTLTLPSQTRYLAYLQRMLNEKIPPSSRSVKILQVTLRTVPNMGEGGCRPYIQIFKDATLIYTSKIKGEEIEYFDVGSPRIEFPMEVDLDGDILIRFRHKSQDGKPVTMLRLAFHTGYLERKAVIPFKRSQLDGAWNNEAFDKDFHLELRVRFSADPGPDQQQSEEFWRIVNTKHDHSQMEALKTSAFNIVGSEDEIDDDDDSDEDEDLPPEELEKKKQLEEQRKLEILQASEKLVEEVVDTEFEDLEKYVKELNMSDGGDADVGDLEADMALLDKLAEDDGDDGGGVELDFAALDAMAEETEPHNETSIITSGVDLDFAALDKMAVEEIVPGGNDLTDFSALDALVEDDGDDLP